MNKEQLLNLIESLNLPKSEYYILSSGVLLLYGVREKAGDLDLCVSPSLFETLKKQFNLTDDKRNSCGFYAITDDVEIVVNEKSDFERTFKDGYPVQTLESILAFKKNRCAPKDIPDIAQIERYLKSNN